MDQFALDLTDRDLLEELTLTCELMAVANTTERHLSQRSVDQALGLSAPGVPGST